MPERAFSAVASAFMVHVLPPFMYHVTKPLDRAFLSAKTSTPMASQQCYGGILTISSERGTVVGIRWSLCDSRHGLLVNSSEVRVVFGDGGIKNLRRRVVKLVIVVEGSHLRGLGDLAKAPADLCLRVRKIGSGITYLNDIDFRSTASDPDVWTSVVPAFAGAGRHALSRQTRAIRTTSLDV
jgi:hypothetical protein